MGGGDAMTKYIGWRIVALVLFAVVDLSAAPGDHTGQLSGGSIRISTSINSTLQPVLSVSASTSANVEQEIKGSTYTTNRDIGGFVFNTSSDALSVSWSTMAAMPTARSQLGVVCLGGKIYAIGGYDGTNALATNEVYDAVANTWSTKASLGTARRRHSVGKTGDDKIYAISGCNTACADGPQLNTIEEYNIMTDAWVAQSANPAPFYGMAVISSSKTISYYDGYDAVFVRVHEIYTVDTDAVSPTSALPSGSFAHATGAHVKGKNYVLGGGTAIGSSNTTREYDPVTNTWAERAVMPVSLSSMSLSAPVVGEKIYVVGGWTNSAVSSNVYVYDVGANTWDSTVAPAPNSRIYSGNIDCLGKVYVIGGYDGAGYVATTYRYDPVTSSSVTFTTNRGLSITSEDGPTETRSQSPKGACGGPFRDSDNLGWTKCYYLNGVQTCVEDLDGRCD